MKFKNSKDSITFMPCGRIDSNTVMNFSNAISSNLGEGSKSAIIFDCKDLDYISSAGLRVLLSLKKKEKAVVKLINVHGEVNDILEVTGFSQIFDVSRGVREISGENITLLAKNEDMSLYRMDSDKILKLYKNGTDFETVENELKYSKAALFSGVPTLISYDNVIFKGQYGIVYEMPNSKTVADVIDFKGLSSLARYAEEMGKALKMIHSCEPEEGILPKTSKIFTMRALKMNKYFHEKELEKLRTLISIIPDDNKFIYGDYHAGNVFLQGDEIILIDMSRASCGNPIFDLARTYMIYVSEANLFAKRLTGLDTIQAKKFWDIFIRAYLGSDDEAFIKHQEKIIFAAALLYSSLMPSFNTLGQENIERFVANARRDIFPIYDNLLQLLAEARF